MFLGTIYIKKCINYRKYIILKINEKLKIYYYLDAQKVFAQ